jgi:D-aspartate ligase
VNQPARARCARVPALVLGSGITALGVQRILANAGIPYFVVDRQDPFLTRSRRYRPLPAGIDPVDPLGLEPWLRQLPLDTAVLLPCSDHWAMAAAQLQPDLGERFPASVARPKVLERFVDKGLFDEMLVDLGIPHPWSRIVDGPDDLDSLPDGGFEAAFLKPRDSARFFRTFGVKAVAAGSRSELEDRLAEVTGAGLGVIVQEYIPGPATNHYFVDGFRDRHGVIRALFARQRLRMYPPRFGNSTFMRSVSHAEVEGALVQLDRLLTATEYRGIFSAEFKLDPRDSLFKLLEVNARAWWYVGFAARCGVDVCAMSHRDALDLDVESVDSYSAEVSCVYPYPDFFACRAALRAGELSVGEWVRSWAASVQPVFQWGDPWPAVAASKEILSGKAANLLRGPSIERTSRSETDKGGT